MVSLRAILLGLYLIQAASAATFGTVTTVVGSVSDIVLDEARRRLYLINSTQTRLEVYSLPPNPVRLVQTIALDQLPLSAAMSRDGSRLYVVCHNSSSLNIIDLDTLTVTARPSLPARPEGVAVGADNRVLITTIGTGPNNSQNTLLVYDPEAISISTVVIVPPAPTLPNLPPPSGRSFLSSRSRLEASADGMFIIGVNIPNNNSRAVFVYEVASGTVLRSRTVTNVSSVLSVAPDGKRFMSGLTLFETETLEVLAQQNLANAPYPIQPGTNFNTQQNQGGSIFHPDGSTLYSAFNIAPVANPAPRPNIGQMMVSDSDNLLIRTAYQMPENLAGKMAITSDGGIIYAISESGFTSIPVGNAPLSPIADLSSPVVLLANDQCGVTASQRAASVNVLNTGRGRLTATAQVLQLNPTGPGGLGGVGGAGGGQPGGGVIIILPPTVPGGAQPPGGVTPLPGGLGNAGRNTAIFQTAPAVRNRNTAEGPVVDVTYNAVNARGLGTITPVHDFLIQSPEAINIPPRLRVYQNNRNSEARADVFPVDVGVSANEALEDIAYDPLRNRVYIANSGKNRIEVFDARTREFLPPIKVGQLPRSMALMPDNNTLYVVNTGGENISIVDLNEGAVIGRVKFPPLPFNAAGALVTPSVIAPSTRGPLIIMSNGTIWKVVGNEAIPRTVSPVLGSNTVQQPRNMVATPNGEYVLLMAGNGFVYLYDANVDDFVQGRQIFTNPIQGYYGPVGAGPNGRYFLVNGTILNSALTPVGSAGIVQAPGAGGQAQTLTRPVSGVVALNNNQYLRFVQPVRLQANNPLVTDSPVVELADANTGNMLRQVQTVEGPVSVQTANQRVNISGRTVAVDPAGTTAYILTTSGLSVVELDAVANAQRPAINPSGVVNLASQTTSVAPGALVAINGRNLGESASVTGGPLPTMLGGTCVTLNNRPLPLAATSPGQISAQLPPELTAGRYPLVVRSIDRKTSNLQPMQVTVARYAPAVIVNRDTKQAEIYHADGRLVTRDNPATRDQRLTIFAVGLGATKGPRVVAGEPAPEDTTTDPVSVFFGDPSWRQAAVVVEESGLVPGMIGIYRIQVYVPGDRMRGDDLDVTIRIGGISSPTTGEFAPKIAVK